MQEWTSSNNAAVRQKRRQETTMTMTGTLPENTYYKKFKQVIDADK